MKDKLSKVTTNFKPTWYNIVSILFIISIIIFYSYSKDMGGIILNAKKYCYITIPASILGITALVHTVRSFIVYQPKH